MKCVINGCSSYTENADEKVSYFSFPTKIARQQQWKRILKGKTKCSVDVKKHRICEKHFDRASLLEERGAKQLTKDAVPVFLDKFEPECRINIDQNVSRIKVTVATAPNVQNDGKILRQFHKSVMSSLATKFDNTEDCIHNAGDNHSGSTKPWTRLGRPKWKTEYYSSSYLAIELIMIESLRRARHNRLSVSASLIQRWSEAICGHIGHKDMSLMPMWNKYFEMKYQIAWTSIPGRVVQVQEGMLSEGGLSMNFDILNDLTEIFGDNIIFPNGGRMHVDAPSEDQIKDLSRFDGPCYVALELILWEYVKRIRQKNVEITENLMGRITYQAVQSIGFVNAIEIPAFIEDFTSKYRIHLTQRGRKKQEITIGGHIAEDSSVIDAIIMELCEHFGPDIILPNGPVSNDTPATCGEGKRPSSPSIMMKDLDLENAFHEKSDWIVDSPPFIALELVFNEWLKRAEYNQVPVSQYVIWRVVEQFAYIYLKFTVSTEVKKWFMHFKIKYDFNFSKSSYSPTSDAPKERKSMILEDIINDLSVQYGETIILAKPGCGKPREIVDPFVGELVGRLREAVLLIVKEWVKRCRHNRFIVNACNLSALVQSISSYLKCKSIWLTMQWTREVKRMFLSQDTPQELCPLGHNFQLTNVYVIIKDLCQIHGKEKILPNTTSIECCVKDEQTVEPEAPKPEDADDSILWPETKELIINDADTSEQAQETPSAHSDMASDSALEVYKIEDNSINTPEILLGNVAIKGAALSGVEAVCKHNPGISSYQDAIESLQSLEQFFLMNEDMRAVGLLNQLENMLKDRIESKK